MELFPIVLSFGLVEVHRVLLVGREVCDGILEVLEVRLFEESVETYRSLFGVIVVRQPFDGLYLPGGSVMCDRWYGGWQRRICSVVGGFLRY